MQPRATHSRHILTLGPDCPELSGQNPNSRKPGFAAALFCGRWSFADGPCPVNGDGVGQREKDYAYTRVWTNPDGHGNS